MRGTCEPIVAYDPKAKTLILTNDQDQSLRTIFESREEVHAFIESMQTIRDTHFPAKPEEELLNRLRERFVGKEVELHGAAGGTLNGLVQDIRLSRSGTVSVSLGPTDKFVMNIENIRPENIHIL